MAIKPTIDPFIQSQLDKIVSCDPDIITEIQTNINNKIVELNSAFTCGVTALQDLVVPPPIDPLTVLIKLIAKLTAELAALEADVAYLATLTPTEIQNRINAKKAELGCP